MHKTYYVYILASQKNGTLYTGVTNDLARRIYEHKTHAAKGFTAKYDVIRLVWFSETTDAYPAIESEKKIKNRGRQWKINLIEKENPEWKDLSLDFLDPATYAQDDDVQDDTRGDVNVVKNACSDLEKRTGKKVISPLNAKNLKNRKELE
jgi:putative endonuclease